MATPFIIDTFQTTGSLATHTSDSGQTYGLGGITGHSSSTFTIESDHTVTNTYAGQSVLIGSAESSGTSVAVSFDLVIKSVDGSFFGVGIGTVISGTLTGYEFRYNSAGSGNWSIYGFGTAFSGGYQQLANVAVYGGNPLGAGTYHCECLLAPSSQTFIVNGSVQCSSTDNTVSSRGYVFFDAASNAETISTGIAIKNLYCYNQSTRNIQAPDNSNVVLSPGNQYINPGTSLEWIHTGTSAKFSTNGTTLGVNVSTAPLVAGSISTGNYPSLIWSLDGGPWQSNQIPNGGGNIIFTTGANTYGHSVEVRFEPLDESDTWTPKSAIIINGWITDYGAYSSISAPTGNATQRPKTLLIDGDSITRGYDATTSGAIGHLCTLSYGILVGHGLNAETGIKAYSGQGVLKSATAVAPSFPNTIGYYDSTHARTVGTPTYWIIAHGTNDYGSNKQAIANAVQADLTTARTMTGGVGSSTIIMWVAPFASTGFADSDTTSDGYSFGSAIALGYQQYTAAYPADIRTTYFDGSTLHYGIRSTTTTQFSTSAGGLQIHPDTEGHALQAADIVAAMKYFEGTLSGTPTGTVISTAAGETINGAAIQYEIATPTGESLA